MLTDQTCHLNIEAARTQFTRSLGTLQCSQCQLHYHVGHGPSLASGGRLRSFSVELL